MSWVKKCPACGQGNSELEFLCAGCGTDISQVKAASPVIAESGAAAPPAAPGPGVVGERKRCPRCGAENAGFAILCDDCGELLGNSPKVPAGSKTGGWSGGAVADAERAGRMPKLELVVGSQVFACRDGDVLGRTGTVVSQVFAGIPTVSGQHVALELREGVWRVVNLQPPPDRPTKNATILDGQAIPIGAAAALTGEHGLQLSSKCVVSLRVSR